MLISMDLYFNNALVKAELWLLINAVLLLVYDILVNTLNKLTNGNLL